MMSTATLPPLTQGPLAQEFEELFREHYQLVYRTAYGVTARAEDAEDVLQTVFLKLLRRQTPPDFQKNRKGYLYRAAVTVSLDIVQKRQRHVLTDDMSALEVPQEVAQVDEQEVQRKRLSQALSQLRPRAVEILILRYEHDYSDAEIAKMLGTSRGVIAVSLYRSRARLKKILNALKEGK
jgi:RNA polymerase sigma-70 factor (ECF subfamily)